MARKFAFGGRFRAITSSRILGDIFAMAGGAAGGQAVTFLFSPLITRIYDPATFGLQGVFLALVSVLAPLIALRLPMAMVIAKNERMAENLASLSLAVSLLIAGALCAVLALVPSGFIKWAGADQLGNLIWFLPLALLCTALQDVATLRASRRRQFRIIGRITISQAIFTNFVRVVGGIFAPVGGILVAVTTFAPALQAALLTRQSPSLTQSKPVMRPKLAFLLLKRFKDFPLYRMPNDVLNSASQSVPVIMLGALYGPAVAGLYVLTRSVLNLPANVIGTASGNVLYVKFAESGRGAGTLISAFKKSTLVLLSFSPAIIGAAWFSPTIFAFFFGEEWREAGAYAQWMSIWIAMMIANIPSAKVAAVIGRQGLAMTFNIGLFIFRVFSVWVVWYLSGSALMAIASYSICSAIMIALNIVTFFYVTKKFDRKLNV
ncbi:oligosaccharide flippase family protein [Qipengyuania sp. NPDC077563]|uniref:oligosaccharide flippase family protein n=1 Tax=Qipengyuania sp. NPDC077563 TaxID=3364497 RepID=UPI00384AE299